MWVGWWDLTAGPLAARAAGPSDTPPASPGAYLVPYLVLLLIIGIPLFFLELAVGQRIRRGSIGVWHYVCPRLGGIGFSSCIVSRGMAVGPHQDGGRPFSDAESWAGKSAGRGPLNGRIASSWCLRAAHFLH